MRFREIITVHDERRPSTRAELTARRLADAGNLPLTTLGTPSAATPLHDGPLGAQIVEQVGGRDGALLVIEAFGGGASGDRLYDTDAEYVLQHLPQPVMVLGPGAAPPVGSPSLVVPVDGSAFADAAVPVIDRWCHTFSRPNVSVVGLEAPDPWPVDDGAATPNDAERIAGVLAEHGCPAGVRHHSTADPGRALLDVVGELHGHAVLVIPAPRWHGLTHWYSTVRRLIRHAGCPIIVVPAAEIDAAR